MAQDAAAGDHALLALQHALALVAAADITQVLRAAVEAACRLTGSSRGLAGLYDGQAGTSDAWFDVEDGWTAARLRWARGQGGPGHVYGSRTPLLANDLPAAAGGLEDAREILGIDSFICVPLLGAGGEPLGFIEVGDRGRTYAPQDVPLLTALAAVTAVRLADAAGAGRAEILEQAALAGVAERLQRRLLPGAPPELPGVDIAFAYRSASTGVLSGGDFVDYYSRPPSPRLAFSIGDVSGKGVDAMATTFVTKYILQAAVRGGQLSWPTHPGLALQELRNGLLEQPDFGPDSERFVTVLFGELDPRRGTLQLASAGHPTPFLVTADDVVRPLLVAEAAIGVELGAALEAYPTETLQMVPGDTLVLFTDGIAEVRDAGGVFFEDQMAGVLEGFRGATAQETVDGLLAEARDFSARPPADDVAVLCIRLTEHSEVN